MGVYRLDGLVLTHYDADHAGGIDELLSRVPADTVFLPSQSDDLQMQQQVLQASGNSEVYVEEDMHLTWATASLDIYAPETAHSDNERSLCVLFRTEKCAILLARDKISGGFYGNPVFRSPYCRLRQAQKPFLRKPLLL